MKNLFSDFMNKDAETNGKQHSFQPREQNLVAPQSFRLNPFGLAVIGTPTWEEWIQCGRVIRFSRESVHFWIGDWLLYGEKRWGEKYKEAQALTGFDYQTLANDKTTAYAVPPEKRRAELSFSHYELITKFDEEEQDEYIEAAIQNKFTVRDFDTYIKKKEAVFENTPNKVSPHGETYVPPTSPDGVKQDQDNLFTIQSAQTVNEQLLDLNGQFLAKLDEINFENLSPDVREKFLKHLEQTSKILEQTSNRIHGLLMTYVDE